MGDGLKDLVARVDPLTVDSFDGPVGRDVHTGKWRWVIEKAGENVLAWDLIGDNLMAGSDDTGHARSLARRGGSCCRPSTAIAT